MLPDADELPETLLDLAVPHEDINELIALRRTLAADPGALRLLEECVGELVADMGEVGGRPQLAERLAEVPPALAAHFAVYVLVAALPHTRAHHRARGVPDDVSRHTLADLGRQMTVHRRRHGSGGLSALYWLMLHFRGELYQLGRLQFQRTVLDERMARAVKDAGRAAAPGDPCLGLHIPDHLGPLTPSACARSLRLARPFFARHFPGERYEAAKCHSWLLDPQLRRHLAPESNIVRFQELFVVLGVDTEPSDKGPVGYVFGDPDLPAAELPRTTSMERAVGDHLRSGGHWYLGHGWFPLEGS
ncbi:acyltransferase [Streptomyces mangrovisoli]|uniref:Acyltransferase n=1 Tax=Streptomyces mangrovisoli TaxID=1428628 RepID=A0A1J4P2S7_9ACTN|nr:acyltransferase [Streptomyces mangrovisoli]